MRLLLDYGDHSQIIRDYDYCHIVVLDGMTVIAEIESDKYRRSHTREEYELLQDKFLRSKVAVAPHRAHLPKYRGIFMEIDQHTL